VAESCTICSSRSRRPIRKLLDTLPTAVLLVVEVFWVVTLCSVVDGSGMDLWNAGTYHNTTQRHNSEDLDSKYHSCASVKTHTRLLVWSSLSKTLRFAFCNVFCHGHPEPTVNPPTKMTNCTCTQLQVHVPCAMWSKHKSRVTMKPCSSLLRSQGSGHTLYPKFCNVAIFGYLLLTWLQ